MYYEDPVVIDHLHSSNIGLLKHITELHKHKWILYEEDTMF